MIHGIILAMHKLTSIIYYNVSIAESVKSHLAYLNCSNTVTFSREPEILEPSMDELINLFHHELGSR